MPPTPQPSRGQPPRSTPPPAAAAVSPEDITERTTVQPAAASDSAEVPTLSPETPPGGPSVAEPPALVGKSFGDLEVLEEIGRGGMGVVYKARQIGLDRVVALKMLLADQFQNAVRLSRFLAEARTAAALAHPNIVSVYQIGECSFGHYFVMEYIDGDLLEDRIKSRVVPIPWTTSLLVAVAEAVHYAHTKGVIHRDLKPGNIMIDRLRRPVVMDFGIAKYYGKPSSLTQQGSLVGTPSYMSPEQAGEELGEVGPPSDVYSLGAILYHLLTGRPPFDEGTALRTILKVISAELPAPMHTLRPDVPPELERICAKAMSKKAADRYASAHALAEDLRRFRSGQATSTQQMPSRQTARPSVLLIASKSGKQVRLHHPTTVIGRASECDLVIKSSHVSKKHCQILLQQDGSVRVEDLGSANGICVNGDLVRNVTLKDGDTLDIAGYAFEVRFRKPKKA